MNYYIPDTQALADLFPPDHRLRRDLFSVGQQFLQGVTGHLRHLRTQLYRWETGRYLQNPPLNLPDTLRLIYLGDDFQFHPDLSDPRRISYRTPFLRGITQGQIYPIQVLPNNHLEDIENTVFTRIASDLTKTVGPEVLPPTPVAELHQATLQPLTFPGHVYITLQGSTQLGSWWNQQFFPANLSLRGVTTKGTIEEEVIEFPANLTVRTKKRYLRLLQITPRHIFPDTATLSLSGPEHRYHYHLDESYTIFMNRQEQAVIWALEDGVLSSNYVVLQDEKSLTFNPYLQWQLINSQEQPIPAQSMAVIPQRPWLGVVYDNTLYLYHKFLEYPSQERLLLLTRRTDGLSLSIEADHFTCLPGQSIEIRAVPTTLARRPVQFRWEVARPGEGFQPYQPDTSLILQPSTEAVWLPATDERLLHYYSLPLETPGWWGVALYGRHQDGTVTTDIRLTGALQKAPLAEYPLNGIISNPEYLFVDSDEYLWVVSGNTAKRLVCILDAALVDYERKLLLLTHTYDEVEVIP